MADKTGPVGELATAIRTMLGLTRHSRLRDQLGGTIELYRLISDQDGLDEAKSNLAKVITIHSERLLAAAGSKGRAWNWGSFVVALVIGFGLAWFTWFARSNWSGWWADVLVILTAVTGGLFVIAGFAVLLEEKSAES